MPITDGDRLRSLLGEEIPVGGGEGDTLFTNEAIEDLLVRFPDLEDAAREGWKIKAAKLANLVNTAEAGAKRDLGDLYDQAMKMVNFYGGSSVADEPLAGPGRVKIRNLGRTESE